MKRSPNACANLPLEIKRARQYYTTAYSSKIAPLCASRPERCYFGNAPAIARLGLECGDDFAVWWIADQVASYSTTLSEADRLTSADIDQLSLAIYANYSTLNLAELMLFFSRLAAGIYGQVAFGRVRPENITAKIPLFMAARLREIDRYDRLRESMERAAEEEHRRKYAVSHQEYKRMLAAFAAERFAGNEDEAQEYIAAHPTEFKKQNSKMTRTANE